MNETKSKRGFAALSPERRAEISRKGGISAHQKGRAHTWNTETARVAGAKGGAMSGVNRRMRASAPVV